MWYQNTAKTIVCGCQVVWITQCKNGWKSCFEKMTKEVWRGNWETNQTSTMASSIDSSLKVSSKNFEIFSFGKCNSRSLFTKRKTGRMQMYIVKTLRCWPWWNCQGTWNQPWHVGCTDVSDNNITQCVDDVINMSGFCSSEPIENVTFPINHNNLSIVVIQTIDILPLKVWNPWRFGLCSN